MLTLVPETGVAVARSIDQAPLAFGVTAYLAPSTYIQSFSLKSSTAVPLTTSELAVITCEMITGIAGAVASMFNSPKVASVATLPKASVTVATTS